MLEPGLNAPNEDERRVELTIVHSSILPTTLPLWVPKLNGLMEYDLIDRDERKRF